MSRIRVAVNGYGAMWEVALWKDILTFEGRDAYCAYEMDNQAIVIQENIEPEVLQRIEGDALPRRHTVWKT